MARNYRKNILLVFDDFDPVSNYVFKLVDETKKIVALDVIVFIHHAFKPKSEGIFLQSEKMMFLSSTIPNTPSPMNVIYGESFIKEKITISEKINFYRKMYCGGNFYILLDSNKFNFLVNGKDWSTILSTSQIVLYIFPEHKDISHSYSLTSQNILFINPSKEINEIKNSSIYDVGVGSFSDLIVDVINKSDVCAFKRIQKHLSEKRFQHSVRVAETVKKICDLLHEEDEEFRYYSYISAIYHDICKELPEQQQRFIAENILGMDEYSSWKVLHGPIASWYLRKKYLFDNQDVLEAVANHTIPGENPKKMTMLLYLADRLEPGKKDRYPANVYNESWRLISEECLEASFYYFLNWSNEARNNDE